MVFLLQAAGDIPLLHASFNTAAEGERLEQYLLALNAFTPFDYVFTSRSFLKHLRLFRQLLIMLY